MKFLLSVFLLISKLFSIIKTGTGLYCYQTEPSTLCRRKVENFYGSEYGFGGNKDQLERSALSCLKSRHNERNTSCEYTSSRCSKLSLKFKDGKQNFFTYCDAMLDGEMLECDSMMHKIDKSGLADAKCDYCTVDGCNSSPNTSHLENNLNPEVENLACLQTDRQDLCIPETMNLVLATQLDKNNLYEFRAEALSCYKRRKEENYDLCEKEKTQCSRLTLKFLDGTQTSVLACDTDRNTTCEHLKGKTKEYLPDDILYSAECDYCKGDSCHNIEDLSEPVEEWSNRGSNLYCFETELDYMCEREFLNWQENYYLESNAVNCLKRQTKVQIKRCKSPNSECSKLSLKFKDGNETDFSFCDSHYTCEDYKYYLDHTIKDELMYAQCDYCSEDSCNSNRQRTIFRKPEKAELRCYYSDYDSCKEKIRNFDDLISCLSQAEIRKKEDCAICVTEIYTNSDNQKMKIAICGDEKIRRSCNNSTRLNKQLKSTSHKLKNVVCIPCKYNLCNGEEQKQRLGKDESGNQVMLNDPQKRNLTRNETGNQIVSNFTVIIFISLLVHLMI